MNATTVRSALPPPPTNAIAAALRVPKVSTEWLAGDGSDRCYYRVLAGEERHPYVLMQLSGSDAEALRINGYDWVTLSVVLQSYQIVTPRLHATIPEYAALIIEDYGNDMLETIIQEKLSAGDLMGTSALYEQAAAMIARMLCIPKNEDSIWCKRSFDSERFHWELDFFMKQFAHPVGRISLSHEEEKKLKNEFEDISKFLGSFSSYFVHRDYHSRNIMVRGKDLAMIDFQDARLGPPSYDLVSLVFDSYVGFSKQQRTKLMEDCMNFIAQTASEKTIREIEVSWRPMLLQRQLKALGSFGFLTLVKNRGNYLRYVAPALETLSHDLVYDERWPFLSGVLLDRLRQSSQS